MCRGGMYIRWDHPGHSDIGHFVAVTSDVDISSETLEAMNPDSMYFQVVDLFDGGWDDSTKDRLGGWQPSVRATAPLAALAFVATCSTLMKPAPHVHSLLPPQLPHDNALLTGDGVTGVLRDTCDDGPSRALMSRVSHALRNDYINVLCTDRAAYYLAASLFTFMLRRRCPGLCAD